MYDVAIPVYNEGSTIAEVLKQLDEHVTTSIRVLILYDNDNDDTLPVIKNYSSPKFKIECIKNRYSGVLGAIKTGFEYSESKCVLIFPADDTLNANILDQMFVEFEKGADIVAASRFMKGGCMEGCPWIKATLVRLAAFSLYHVARTKTHDPTNGFRLFSRRVLDSLPIETKEGFAFSIELMVKAQRRGWAIAEVPALWIERKVGESRFKVFKWLPIYLRWYRYAFMTLISGSK